MLLSLSREHMLSYGNTEKMMAHRNRRTNTGCIGGRFQSQKKSFSWRFARGASAEEPLPHFARRRRWFCVGIWSERPDSLWMACDPEFRAHSNLRNGSRQRSDRTGRGHGRKLVQCFKRNLRSDRQAVFSRWIGKPFGDQSCDRCDDDFVRRRSRAL